MILPKVLQGRLARVILLNLALSASGCALLTEESDVAPAEEVTVVEPTADTTVETPPVPDATVTPEPRQFSPRVAIVLSDDRPAYGNVAAELGGLLSDYSIYNLSQEQRIPKSLFAGIADSDASVVVAVGLRAATTAKAFAKAPVVFCQVFNVADNDLVSDSVKGVAALPPMHLQIAAWKELNPGLENVGVILGEGHEDLIEEATRATEAAGIALHHRTARSDRETLYLFNRLTPEIEGFLLFPDNRILSHHALREILKYATRHRVQVAVFNSSLLGLGAALSSSSIDSDVARTVVSVAGRLLNGDGDRLPAITPLNEIDVRTNQAVFLDAPSASGTMVAEEPR